MKDLYRRITKVKPHYPKEKLIGEAQENEKYRCSISRNARKLASPQAEFSISPRTRG
jgi:hypothetical protein